LIYSESGIEPTTDRRDWLSSRYLVFLNQNPVNPTYESVKSLHESNESWPPRCSPSLKTVSDIIKNQGFNLFRLPAGSIDKQLNNPPLGLPLLHTSNGSRSRKARPLRIIKPSLICSTFSSPTFRPQVHTSTQTAL
jgi:hypothetical protein